MLKAVSTVHACHSDTEPVRDADELPMVTCGICHEEHLPEIGELDSCDHR